MNTVWLAKSRPQLTNLFNAWTTADILTVKQWQTLPLFYRFFNKIPAGLGNDDVSELYFCLVQSGELQSRVNGAYRALGLFWP